MKKYFVCAIVISAVMALSVMQAFAQPSQTPAKDDTAAAQGTQSSTAQASPASQVAAQPAQVAQPTPAAPAEIPAKTNELSIYGEVQAVNAQASSISVQYYDYDNDEEKTLEVSLDKDSKLENVKAITEVKKGDWVDVTYTSAAGKNTAKMVSVEKEEPTAEDNAPVGAAE